MSRKIKFRAWGKETKEFYFDVQETEVIVRNWDIEEEKHGWPVNSLSEFLNNKNFTLEQFTGLKDKNGKEIYEGDIIAVDKFQLGVVSWSNEEATWEFKDKVMDSCGTWAGGWQESQMHELKHWKIIGNIHENPELMK